MSADPTTPDRLARWRTALRDSGSHASRTVLDAAGQDVLDAWSAPHRHHHDLAHLDAVLDALELLAADEGRAVPATVRLAAWFHDVVYDAVPGQDERASAETAGSVLGRLGVPGPQVAEVARLVLLTVDHETTDEDADGALLLDADLAVLAAPAGAYRAYVRGVRAEYARMPDDAFTAGRRAVLTALARRAVLFRTASGRRRWDAAARANLAAELAGDR